MLAKLALVAALTLAVQPLELGPDLSGLSRLVRLGFQSTFLLSLVLVFKELPSGRHIAFAVSVCLLLLSINLLDGTPYVFIALSSVVMGILAGYYFESGAKYDLMWVVTKCIQFNMIGLAIQYTIFLVTGDMVDLHHVLLPFSYGRHGYYLGFGRLTGFFIEPGTYSQWVYMLVFMRILLGAPYASLTNVIAVLSCVLTFSAWAFMAALFFVSCLVVSLFDASAPRRWRIRLLLWLVVASLIFVVAYSLFADEIHSYFEYITVRYADSGPMNRFRFDGLNEFYRRMPEVELFGNRISDPVCAWCKSVEDIGVWSSFTYYVGLLPTLTLGCALAARLLRRGGSALLIASLPLVFTKAPFYEPLVWSIISVALCLVGISRPELRSGRDRDGLGRASGAASAGRRMQAEW